ncbi:MAG: NUDIX domain-containing protein [Burkholderiaceae bacterium]|uniref:NUDIX hydrolase n=1 Tax=Polaromonas sp. TaxID=1869339 RepID=UPI00271900BE|nr:NUDIX domain-containing protein [Polaromonas sp.]MDO8777895.1 NUDIX domain-containing protein [Burkholderiaceae bacterium]MDP2451350.1 NUDIX domain-containing protein [Polaromonas sp.]MDP3828303.1 NUDIX domain-containing protein [Polaromonas sp.]
MDKITPRNAATVAVARDGPAGLETLLLQRAERGDHNSGAWVFPGGLVDAADADVPVAGLSDERANATLAVEQGGLAFYVAAIRECLEEAGLLFATNGMGQAVRLESDAGARLLDLRPALQSGTASMAEACRELQLRLAADRLFYVAHWLTPVGRAKRFDTRFFVAVVPQGQESAHDHVETLDHIWIRPSAALAPENTRRLMTPTRAVLELLTRFADTAALVEWARSPREVMRVLPRLATDASGPRPVLPHEAAWEEVGLLDPEGKGTAWCEPRADVPVRLSPTLCRVMATNGGNTYVVGAGECVVVAPASAAPAHLDAVIAALAGPLTTVICDDEDQMAAAEQLQLLTGAALVIAPRRGFLRRPTASTPGNKP